MIGNLLDQRYEEITGYTSAGFSALLGFRLRSR
jgi:outer membrane cobalamin receptor